MKWLEFTGRRSRFVSRHRPWRAPVNAALVTFLADLLGVSRRFVRVISGELSRDEIVAVAGVRADLIHQLVEE